MNKAFVVGRGGNGQVLSLQITFQFGGSMTCRVTRQNRRATGATNHGGLLRRHHLENLANVVGGMNDQELCAQREELLQPGPIIADDGGAARGGFEESDAWRI